MWLPLVLCGLLSFDSALAPDVGKSQSEGFGEQGIPDDFLKRSNETEGINLQQQILDYLEMLEYADEGMWPRKNYFKRDESDYQVCGLRETEHIQGLNDFQLPQVLRGFKKQRWDNGYDTLLRVPHPNQKLEVKLRPYFPPEKCLPEHEQRTFNFFTATFPVEGGRDQEQTYTITSVPPSSYIKEFIWTREKTGGCRCKFWPSGLGCVCCFWWEYFETLFCGGISYNPKDLELLIEFTVQDRLVLKLKRNCSQSALSKFFERFTKPSCFEKTWKIFNVKLCTKLFGRVDIHWDDPTAPGMIQFCMQVTGYFLFFDMVLFEPPCWSLKFGGNDTNPRSIGIPKKPQLYYEHGQMEVKDPVKLMYTVKNIEAIAKYMNALARAERNKTKQILANATGKILLIDGEDPKVLKKGKPTAPINWSPIDIKKLNYLVVLYTQPMPAPLTLDDKDHAGIPDFEDMIKAGLSMRTEDPTNLNRRVQTVLGKTCGGVAVSRDKIMTMCACVQWFYLFHKFHRTPTRIRKDPFSLDSSDIYITFAERSFNADQMVYELVQNTDYFMEESECFKVILKASNVEEEEDPQTGYIVHSQPVVMPFTPQLTKFETLTLVPWIKVSIPTPMEMVAIGLHKRKLNTDLFGADGYELDPQFEAVRIPFQSCEMTRFCSQMYPWESDHPSSSSLKRFHCVCANDKNFQLCDGVIGFPIIHKLGLVGLNTIPMHCKDEGSMPIAVFTVKNINAINAFIRGEDHGRSPSPHPITRKPPKPPKTKKPNSGYKLTTSATLMTTAALISLA